MSDGAPSLLPLAARAIGTVPLPGLEALLRPRIPVTMISNSEFHATEDQDQDQDTDEVENGVEDHHTKMELDEAISRPDKEVEEIPKPAFQPPALNFPDSFSTKRSTDAPVDITSPKRPRFQELPLNDFSRHLTKAAPPKTDPGSDHTTTHDAIHADDSSDDDGSDFEVPPLVFADATD
jgi:hypothetical protein